MATEAALRFFFYGTLIAGSENAAARAVHRKLRALGPARTPGTLHAIPDPAGWYPALVAGRGTVHGRLYESTADFGPTDLAALDAYEDCAPGDPADSLYRRETIAIVGGSAAQAYRFNRPLPAGARPIPGGNFAAWLAATGALPFRG